MLTINIITLFPELFKPFLEHLPLSRAIEKEKLKINLVQLRNYAIDERGTVDDRPYGGGVGMILRVEPIWNALTDIYNLKDSGESLQRVKQDPKNSIIALSPSGQTLNHKKVKNLAEKTTVTLICGRYEGMDARIKENLATEVISIGDFVLSGGEIPALTVIEAVTRLLPGVIEKKEAIELESFSKKLDQKKEYPQYTRPEVFKGMRVPEVLLSGNHAKIKEWQSRNQ